MLPTNGLMDEDPLSLNKHRKKGRAGDDDDILRSSSEKFINKFRENAEMKLRPRTYSKDSVSKLQKVPSNHDSNLNTYA